MGSTYLRILSKDVQAASRDPSPSNHPFSRRLQIVRVRRVGQLFQPIPFPGKMGQDQPHEDADRGIRRLPTIPPHRHPRRDAGRFKRVHQAGYFETSDITSIQGQGA